VSELALFLVRTGFLVVLWIFVFNVISVIRADLFGQKVVSTVAEANAPVVFSEPVLPEAPASTPLPEIQDEGPAPIANRLVILAGERKGQELLLDRREVSIGRAENADLVIRDEFTSTHHAKLVQLNNEWLIQDLNSTNGTFLEGKRVGTPVVVALNTPVQIGNTIFELRA
jgi:hypothetical protein